MTVVVDAVEESEERDPFGPKRIEVDRDSMERASPEAWLARVSARVDDAVTRFVWGR